MLLLISLDTWKKESEWKTLKRKEKQELLISIVFGFEEINGAFAQKNEFEIKIIFKECY